MACVIYALRFEKMQKHFISEHTFYVHCFTLLIQPISVKARNNFRSFQSGFVSHEIKVSAPQQNSQAKY